MSLPWEDVEKLRCAAPDISYLLNNKTNEGVEEILELIRSSSLRP